MNRIRETGRVAWSKRSVTPWANCPTCRSSKGYSLGKVVFEDDYYAAQFREWCPAEGSWINENTIVMPCPTCVAFNAAMEDLRERCAQAAEYQNRAASGWGMSLDQIHDIISESIRSVPVIKQ